MASTDDFSILDQSSEFVAQRLLGCWLVRELHGRKIIGRIVETEAYDETDTASHSYKGRTPRTDVMFGPSGYLYVYFTYGMHYCMNIVCGSIGTGSAVLVRAIEPVEGEDVMSDNRRGKLGVNISNGPAKTCQALAIKKSYNGHNLHMEPMQLVMQPEIPTEQITRTTRIGITHAQDVPWRFYITDNTFVSKL